MHILPSEPMQGGANPACSGLPTSVSCISWVRAAAKELGCSLSSESTAAADVAIAAVIVRAN